MPHSLSGSNLQVRFEQTKQVDAICDRFELAWTPADRPCIEEYLMLLSPADRPLLFRELLASELGLRVERDEVCGESEYLQRFPQYESIITAEFERYRARAFAANGATWEDECCELIQAFQQRRRGNAATPFAYDCVEPDLRKILTTYRTDFSFAPGLSPEQELWLRIVDIGRKTKLLYLAGIESIVEQVLEPFSDLRRAILVDVLLGATIAEAATKNRVTERTVNTTLRTTTELLATIS